MGMERVGVLGPTGSTSQNRLTSDGDDDKMVDLEEYGGNYDHRPVPMEMAERLLEMRDIPQQPRIRLPSVKDLLHHARDTHQADYAKRMSGVSSAAGPAEPAPHTGPPGSSIFAGMNGSMATSAEDLREDRRTVPPRSMAVYELPPGSNMPFGSLESNGGSSNRTSSSRFLDNLPAPRPPPQYPIPAVPQSSVPAPIPSHLSPHLSHFQPNPTSPHEIIQNRHYSAPPSGYTYDRHLSYPSQSSYHTSLTPMYETSHYSNVPESPNAYNSLSTMYSSNSVQSSFVDKKRRRATADQVSLLSSIYNKTMFPSTDLRRAVGRELGMSPRKVQIWFQNKRQAAKGQRRSSDFSGKLSNIMDTDDQTPSESSISSTSVPMDEQGAWEILRNAQVQMSSGGSTMGDTIQETNSPDEM